jgi:hypothetical protein
MVWALLNQEQGAAMEELTGHPASDRVTAIIGGAMLDDALRKALESRLRPTDGTYINEKLFKVGGALGNCGPRIDLAYQLYMIEKIPRNAMYGITEIRNSFAHDLTMSFNEPAKKLQVALDKLKFHEGRSKYPHPFFVLRDSDFEIEAIKTPKDRFIVNLKLCLIWLMHDRDTHMPNSNVPNPTPGLRPSRVMPPQPTPDTPPPPSTPHPP